ncbi:endonuclease III [Qingrenia yutianensis]|uniref:Endonuclease III n=1 Tax=Qingrenia yutianensis TaxID=2763676 RepID=A0A926F717_9FIRM|nr:endonuclease III [Qingrenia yutianensis]MBC8595433.1 endonuclease III [Qingrenia yutianensis]
MRRSEKVLKIKEIFDRVYADAKCSLDYTEPYQLLIAVVLSAQCTDKRVNIVTQTLFDKYKTLKDFADADIDELAEAVKPCGFYKTKSRNIKALAQKIIEEYGGKIPDTMEELTALPGVGRKTANLILGDVYGKPALVIDTHAIRLTGRIGLTKETDPKKIEFDLKKFVPDDYSIHFCHQLVWHGRAICTARSPKCEICPIAMLCRYYEKTYLKKGD